MLANVIILAGHGLGSIGLTWSIRSARATLVAVTHPQTAAAHPVVSK